MRTIQILFSLTILNLLSCQSDKTIQKRNNEINRIYFATGGCFGECPVFAMEIDSTLTYKFNGIKYTNKQGFYIGKVTQEFWDTLNIKFERINFKQLDSSYEQTLDDVSTETIIYYGKNRKHIRGQEASLPENVRDVYKWLMESYKTIELKQTTDSSLFDFKQGSR
jgi:hypothetical protein